MYKYIIYKVTNIVNNKIYIGKHKTKNINDNYIGSGKILKKSIKKYGKGKFLKEILYIFNTEEKMNEMEKEIVDEEFVKRNDVYNIGTGGQGGDLGGANIGPNHASNKYDNDYFRKLAESGGKSTAEKLKNDSEYKEEFSKLVSEGMTNYYKSGGESGFKNKKHTEEWKKRLGRINSLNQFGKNNSQYGTIWIYNLKLKENKKIKKEDLQSYIDIGWIKGRKMSF